MENSKKEKMDKQFTGAFPRYSGAISEVTGGPPEDMNEMPATPENVSAPIYDGSDLAGLDKSSETNRKKPSISSGLRSNR